MTIERDDDGYFVVECDNCGDIEALPVDDFMEFVEEIKELGWQPYQYGGVWNHKCPLCKGG